MFKCLICYSNLPSSHLTKVKSAEDKIKIGDNSGGGCLTTQKSLLSKHLDVIFILRNIFQVPVTQLSDYLKSCPKVDEWICICEKCDELVRGYRAIYHDMLDISRKIEEAKGGIIGIVKKSYDKTNSGTQNDPAIFLNITDECRRFINDYEYQRPLNPFIEGDLKVNQLLNQQEPRTRSQTKSDLSSLTTTTTLTTCSNPEDDFVSYDDDDNEDNFEPDELNSDLNEDDEEDDDDEDEFTLTAPRNSYKRKHIQDTSKEWKPPFYLSHKPTQPQKYECENCSQIFPTKSQLLLHFKDNHPTSVPPTKRKYPPEFYTVSDTRKRRLRSKVPSQCPHCSKMCGSQDSLRQHIKFRHLQKFSFHCRTCGIGRPSKKSLDSHEAQCLTNPPDKCPEEGCHFLVPQSVGLENHFRDVHPQRELFARCPVCEEGVYTEKGLERHLQRNHKEIKPFKCNQCGKGFKTKQFLKIHKRCHDEGGSEGIICDHCGKKITKDYLKEHVRTQHENEFKWRCDQCGKGFVEEEHMKVHLFKRHQIGDGSDLKWRCKVEGCSRICYAPKQFESHMAMHEGKTPQFTCEECGKQFYGRGGLTQHRKLIHANKEGEKKFKCEVCGGEFGILEYLKRHKRVVHKIFPEKRRQDL